MNRSGNVFIDMVEFEFFTPESCQQICSDEKLFNMANPAPRSERSQRPGFHDRRRHGQTLKLDISDFICHF